MPVAATILGAQAMPSPITEVAGHFLFCGASRLPVRQSTSPKTPQKSASMEIIIKNTYDEMSAVAARAVARTLSSKPNTVFGLLGGSTPPQPPRDFAAASGRTHSIRSGEKSTT
jgi:hypothetical protein